MEGEPQNWKPVRKAMNIYLQMDYDYEKFSVWKYRDLKENRYEITKNIKRIT